MSEKPDDPAATGPTDEASLEEQPAQPDPQPEPEPQPAHDRLAAFRLRGDPPRVVRLSRRTLAVIGLTVGIAIGGTLIYALRPPGKEQAVNLYDMQGGSKADLIISAPSDYARVPRLGPPLPGDLGGPIVSAQANGMEVSPPQMGPQTSRPPDPRLAAAEQARQQAAQEQDTARMSQLFLGNGGVAPVADASTLPAVAAAALPATEPAMAGDQSNKQSFLRPASERSVVSPGRVTAPASVHILQAGSVIPAALITGVRSDLPGQVTAQVTQNVYDSPTGRILLIAQGSRLIGEYDSDVSAGQRRVLLAWDRLILPGGRSILLERQPGADAAGMAGLEDRVDFHWGNVIRAALVSTLLGAGTQMAAGGDDALTRALRQGTQDTINQAGQRLVEREAGLAPTLTLRPGHLLNVIVTRDLVLEPLAREARR